MSKPILVFSYVSTWALRAWIALKQGNVPFDERIIDWKSPARKSDILKYNPAGKVPALIDGGLTVHESIAILEYVNETCLGGRLLPADKRARAVCRSVSAEMHAGFASLRGNLPLKFDRKPEAVAIDEAARGEIDRVGAMWEALRKEYKAKGPYLFGEWSMADCMYLPVCARFDNYLVDLSKWPEAQAYSKMMLALPLFQEWKQKGFAAAQAA
jgi:glutathione S-transferase